MQRLCRQAFISAVHKQTASLSPIFHVCQGGKDIWNILAGSDENKEIKQEYRAGNMNTF